MRSGAERQQLQIEVIASAVHGASVFDFVAASCDIMGMKRQTIGGVPYVITGETGPVTVLLHGFGAPGDDLVPLARFMNLPNQRFAFPCAPLSLGAMMGNGRAWWMIDMAKVEAAIASGTFRDMSQDTPEGLEQVRSTMELSLRALMLEMNVDSISLGGFSQGAMLSTDLFLESDLRIDRLALLSGTVLRESQWQARMGAREKVPVFQSHGRQDMILDFSLAERLHAMWVGANFAVEWLPFEGGHEIPPSVLEKLAQFLQAG